MLLAASDHASRGGEHGPRFIFPFLLIVLVSLLIAKIVRRRKGAGVHGHRYGSPMQTLQDRFARGEIDRAEFEHRKAVLEGSDTIPPAPARSAPAQGAPANTPEPDVDNPSVDNPGVDDSGVDNSDPDDGR